MRSLARSSALLVYLVLVAASPAAAQTIDHFTCYRAGTAKGAARFQRVFGVHVVDRFRASDVEVRKPKFLCAPSNKNGEDPTAPLHPEHLVDYVIKPTTKFTPERNVRVVDQFGTHVLDLNKPIGLKVPTAKSHDSMPAEPTPQGDHFQCYGVRTSPNTPAFVPVRGVTIEDQFGALTVDVRKPRRLCLPADKRNESPGAENHPDHLLCYSIRQRSTPRFSRVSPLFINNQFGPLTVDARRPNELCVPALRPPVPPTPTVTPELPTATPTPSVTVPLPTATPPLGCGNGVVDAGEQCDGAAGACPGSCTPLCQCATCGDGLINQPNEECDGLAAPTCPGMCQPNCGCPGVCDPLDPSVCLHPFPNDYFTIVDPATDTGRRVNFSLLSMPRNAAQKPVEPSDYNRSDGFSPGSSIVLRVPGVDLAMTGAVPITDVARSFDPDQPIVVINASTLERHLIWSEIDSNASSEATRALIIRPAVNFEEATRYVVALRNMKDASGATIAPNADFLAYRDGTPTGDAAKESRRAHMEDLFTTLASAGIARDDLYLAWDFTVASSRNLTERMLFLRDDGFARLGGNPPPFVVTQVEDEVDEKIFRRVTGTYLVERYVSSPLPGARFILGPDGLPLWQATPQQANFECNIPRAALANALATANPARASIYGHGLFGTASEVGAGNVTSMGNEHNFVFCATDWIGMSTYDVPNAATILVDLSNFPTLTDRLQQGFLNQLFLARLMIHPQGLVSNAAFRDLLGNPVIDTSDVFYDGNSQGGIFGGSVMAIAQDITRGVLGVPAMNYSTLLTRSVDFDTYASVMYPAYPNELERPLLFALIQMLWDRSDPNGYAHHMTDDPLPNTPPHKVLLHEAFCDHQVANIATEVETRTIGAHVYQPALAPGRHHDVDPYFGIPPIASFPFDGSALVVWDSGNPTPPTTNTPPRPPDYGSDPHGRPRSQVAARLQKSEFLKTDGAIVDVCAAMPCLAP
jgi:hypothetical protein